jgi:putative aldouronate transport system substrate-binding protein
MSMLVRRLALAAALTAAAAARAEETALVGYLLGAPPPGMADVVAALNQRLKPELGVTVEIDHIGWSELSSKYPLVLAAGEGVDWIYTADWCQYAPQAARGAFKELTLDLIQRYMPRHFAATPREAWDQARVNGKIFMIPTSTPDRKVPVMLIRGDLRRRYGLPPVRKVSELGPYLAAVKRSEPAMIPMNLDNGYDLAQPFGALFGEAVPPNTPIQLSSNAIGSPFLGEYEDPRRPVHSVLEEPYASAFRKAAGVMKGWYDKGYLNRNPFANTVLSRDSFAQGKSGVAFANSQNIQEALARAAQAGFDVEIVPILSRTGTYPADPFTNNGVAVAGSSRNVEKTLRFLDLVMEDPAYDVLVYFGVEGKHWQATADGRIGLPPGVTFDRNGYPPDAAGFWFTNKDLFKPLASWSPTYLALRQRVKGLLYASTFTGFTFSPDQVKTEVANLAQAWTQYANPMQIGAVPGVDRAFSTLAQQLRAAKVEKVQAEIRRQVTAFAAAQRR